jgi:phage shock protein A
MSLELAQRIQTMERDLANMKQQIEQLKTGQEQTARNGNPRAA